MSYIKLINNFSAYSNNNNHINYIKLYKLNKNKFLNDKTNKIIIKTFKLLILKQLFINIFKSFYKHILINNFHLLKLNQIIHRILDNLKKLNWNIQFNLRNNLNFMNLKILSQIFKTFINDSLFFKLYWEYFIKNKWFKTTLQKLMYEIYLNEIDFWIVKYLKKLNYKSNFFNYLRFKNTISLGIQNSKFLTLKIKLTAIQIFTILFKLELKNLPTYYIPLNKFLYFGTLLELKEEKFFKFNLPIHYIYHYLSKKKIINSQNYKPQIINWIKSNSKEEIILYGAFLTKNLQKIYNSSKHKFNFFKIFYVIKMACTLTLCSKLKIKFKMKKIKNYLI